MRGDTPAEHFERKTLLDTLAVWDTFRRLHCSNLAAQYESCKTLLRSDTRVGRSQTLSEDTLARRTRRILRDLVKNSCKTLLEDILVGNLAESSCETCKICKTLLCNTLVTLVNPWGALERHSHWRLEESSLFLQDAPV